MPEPFKIILGAIATFGLHAVFWSLVIVLLLILPRAVASGPIGIAVFWGLMATGISQLIYIVPIVLWLWENRRFGWMKGLIVGAVITALLNGGCWLIFLESSDIF
ncbi:MAG: hypothetical protein AAGF01_29220 [Cyanobacteria bacterium P01_G01_bin.38]